MALLEIYVLGDPELVFQALNAVTALFNHEDFRGMLGTALILGIILAGMRHAFSDGIFQAGESALKSNFGPWSLVMPIFVAYMATMPKGTFMVVDGVGGGAPYVVDNVPIVVGFPLAVSSSIGRVIAGNFETVFSQPDAGRMSKRGFMDSLYQLDNLRKLDLKSIRTSSNLNFDLGRSLMRYYVDCVKVDMDSIDPPPTLTTARLKATTDIMGDLVVGAFANIDTVLYTTASAAPSTGNVPTSNETQMSCGQAYELMKNAMADENLLSSAGDMIMGSVYKKQNSSLTLTAMTNEALAAVGMEAMSASRLITNTLISKQLAKAEIQQAAAGGANSQGWAMVLANAEQLKAAKWTTEKTLFDKYSRPFMAFIEILALAVAPLIPFILLTGSSKAMAGWLIMTVWIAMWAPILTLINFFVITKTKAELTVYMNALTTAGITDVDFLTSIEGFGYLASATNEWLAVGAMLSASTPIIAMAVLTGGMTGLTSLAGSLGKSDGTNMSPVAPTPMDSGPVMRGTPQSSLSGFTGASQEGMLGNMPKLSLSGAMSAGVSETRSASQRASEDFAATGGAALTNHLSNATTGQQTRALGRAALESTDSSMSQLQSAVNSASSGQKWSAATREAVMGAAMLAAKVGGGFDIGIFKAGMEGSLSTTSMSAAEKSAAIESGTTAMTSAGMEQKTTMAKQNQSFQNQGESIAMGATAGMDATQSQAYTAARKNMNVADQAYANAKQSNAGLGVSEAVDAFTANAMMRALSGSNAAQQFLSGLRANSKAINDGAKIAAEKFKAAGAQQGGDGSNTILDAATIQSVLESAAKGNPEAMKTAAVLAKMGAFITSPGESLAPLSSQTGSQLASIEGKLKKGKEAEKEVQDQVGKTGAELGAEKGMRTPQGTAPRAAGTKQESPVAPPAKAATPAAEVPSKDKSPAPVAPPAKAAATPASTPTTQGQGNRAVEPPAKAAATQVSPAKAPEGDGHGKSARTSQGQTPPTVAPPAKAARTPAATVGSSEGAGSGKAAMGSRRGGSAATSAVAAPTPATVATATPAPAAVASTSSTKVKSAAPTPKNKPHAAAASQATNDKGGEPVKPPMEASAPISPKLADSKPEAKDPEADSQDNSAKKKDDSNKPNYQQAAFLGMVNSIISNGQGGSPEIQAAVANLPEGTSFGMKKDDGSSEQYTKNATGGWDIARTDANGNKSQRQGRTADEASNVVLGTFLSGAKAAMAAESNGGNSFLARGKAAYEAMSQSSQDALKTVALAGGELKSDGKGGFAVSSPSYDTPRGGDAEPLGGKYMQPQEDEKLAADNPSGAQSTSSPEQKPEIKSENQPSSTSGGSPKPKTTSGGGSSQQGSSQKARQKARQEANKARAQAASASDNGPTSPLSGFSSAQSPSSSDAAFAVGKVNKPNLAPSDGKDSGKQARVPEKAPGYTPASSSATQPASSSATQPASSSAGQPASSSAGHTDGRGPGKAALAGRSGQVVATGGGDGSSGSDATTVRPSGSKGLDASNAGGSGESAFKSAFSAATQGDSPPSPSFPSSTNARDQMGPLRMPSGDPSKGFGGFKPIDQNAFLAEGLAKRDQAAAANEKAMPGKIAALPGKTASTAVATGGEIASNTWNWAKENPEEVAIIALGLIGGPGLGSVAANLSRGALKRIGTRMLAKDGASGGLKELAAHITRGNPAASKELLQEMGGNAADKFYGAVGRAAGSKGDSMKELAHGTGVAAQKAMRKSKVLEDLYGSKTPKSRAGGFPDQKSKIKGGHGKVSDLHDPTSPTFESMWNSFGH